MYAFKRKNIVLFTFILNLIMLAFMIFNSGDVVLANEKEKKNIIILIDKSGSMNKTDSNRLSITAGNMILDYIDNDNIGINIITFGTTVNFNKELRESPTDNELKGFLKNITFNDEETNMKEGMKEAIKQLEGLDGEKFILMLSDGEDYINGGITDEYKKEFENLINKATLEKIKIHTIGLSQEADHKKLIDVSNKTSGTYRFALTADSLYDSFIGIIGEEEKYSTISNYVGDGSVKEIKLSSMVEDVIVNVASCENKVPDVKVLVEGKEIQHEKPDDLFEKYRIYRFENKKNNTIEIITDKEYKNSVIVQARSKAEITADFNINNAKERINLQKNIPISLVLNLDGVEESIEGVYFEKYVNGELINNIGECKDGAIDEFKESNLGDYNVNYVAKDSNGGYITSKDISININNEPSYYYELDKETLKEGEIFRVKVSKLDEQEVKGINARLIMEGKEDIELVQDGQHLKCEVPTTSMEGDIKYKVAINGISNGVSFAYELPNKILSVIKNPIIDIEFSSSHEKYYKVNEPINLELNVKDAILYEDEEIEIFDEDNNHIGSFTLESGEVGKISVSIIPVKLARGMKIFFRANDEVLLTEEVETNIWICNDVVYYLGRFGGLIGLVFMSISILIVVYISGKKVYMNKIKKFSVEGSLRYKNSQEVKSKSLEFTLDICNEKQFLNYRDKSNSFCIDDIGENAIGFFELKYPYSGGTEWIQGLIYLFKGRKYFEVKYFPLEEQEIFYENDLLENEIEYKSGIIIKLYKRKKEIYIEFI